MSGGEPSSIKQFTVCDAELPVLSKAYVRLVFANVRTGLCDFILCRKVGGVSVYRALYRKYRPQAFEDVVGQEHVVETIKNQIINKKISHAYMFTGTRGTGKTTCAKILARAVNCEAPNNGNPCNKCDTCKGILNGSLPDVYEIDAASNNGVDNIRELREDVIFTPALAKYKVYIIDEVHMLSTQAFNALLKTLEEPPEHIIFVFATTEINKVPQTILSRCQRFDFKRITVGDIAKRLKYVAECEKIKLSDSAAHLIAKLADGAMRDALSVLDRCINGSDTVTLETVENTVGICSYDELSAAVTAIADNDTAAVLEFYSRCRRNSKDAVALFSELCSCFRDMIIVKLVKDAGTFLSVDTQRLDEISSLADRFELAGIVRCVSLLQNGIYEVSRYKDKHIMAELTLIRLTNPKLGGDYDDLNARLSKLEKFGVVSLTENTEKKTSRDSAERVEDERKTVHVDNVKDKKTSESAGNHLQQNGASPDFAENLLHELAALGGRSILPFISKSSILTSANILYIVCSKCDFAYSVLSSAENLSIIENAAKKASGSDWTVRFKEPKSAAVEGRDEIDSFSELLSSAEDILYKE